MKSASIPFLSKCISHYLRKRVQWKEINEWKRNGCPVPPPHLIKQKVIKRYQKQGNYQILVETGTFLGHMVEAQKESFKRIYSIELGMNLFEHAREKFKKDTNVTIIQGDSGKVLPSVMKEISAPAIFWLDGHYSEGITARGEKDCPIYEELDAIFDNHKFNHIILIDDARCFTGQGDYPKIEELANYIHKKNDKYNLKVKHDIIRFKIK